MIVTKNEGQTKRTNMPSNYRATIVAQTVERIMAVTPGTVLLHDTLRSWLTVGPGKKYQDLMKTVKWKLIPQGRGLYSIRGVGYRLLPTEELPCLMDQLEHTMDRTAGKQDLIGTLIPCELISDPVARSQVIEKIQRYHNKNKLMRLGRPTATAKPLQTCVSQHTS
jgi:hypothetical protein